MNLPVSLTRLLFLLAIAVLFIQSCSDNSTNPPANKPPTEPTLVAPANGAVAAPTSVNLVWASTDPENDSITYQLFVDNVNAPITVLADNLAAPSFLVEHLSQATTYYWSVIASDRKGAQSKSSPIWQFTVGSFENGWSELAPMSTARFGAASAVVNGKLYVIGGNSLAGTLDLVESYDPALNDWNQLAGMPSHRAYAAAVENNGIIYVIGGETNGVAQQLLESYDPSTDTWSQLEPMPGARTRCAAAVFDNKIYVFGGFQAPTAILTYDIARNQWQEFGTLPAERYNLAVVRDGALFYLIGGSQPDILWLRDITAYDPTTGKTTACASMPTGRAAMQASSIDGKIFVTGGFNVITGAHVYFASVEVYDVADNSWLTRSRMEYPRHDHAAGVIDNKIYVVGGVTDRAPDILNNLEVYDPQLDQ